MPNWTYNTIICSKKVADEILGKDKDGGIIFDFNKLIPMPEDLNIESGSLGANQLVGIYAKNINSQSKWDAAETYLSLNPFYNFVDFFEKAMNLMANRDELEKMDISLGEQYINNFKNYGAATWYQWRVDNWGTKWEACDTKYEEIEDGRVEITFDTAWNIPEGIMKELFERYQDEDIEWIAEDEDYTGTYHYRNDNGMVKFVEAEQREEENEEEWN